MRRKWTMVFCLVLVGLLLPRFSAVAGEEFTVQDALGGIDLTEMEEYRQSLEQELALGLEQGSLKEWLTAFVSGEWSFDFAELMRGLFKYLFQVFIANSGLMARLLVLSAVSALLVQLQSSFGSGISRMSYMACFLALTALAITSFATVLDIGQNTIDTMTGFMTAMLPQMLVLVAGLGNVNASLMLFPLLMGACTLFAQGIKNVVFPLILISAVLSLANQVADTVKVEKLAALAAKLAQICLGLFLTVFVGVVTLRTVYATVLDKVALRTTRFVTDNAVPLVGKLMGDTVEVAAGYVVMLKQALGLLGVLVVLGIVISPLVRIAIIALIYRVVAAVVEPMGDARTAVVLQTLSGHLIMMLAAIAAVGLMFFFMIAIVAGTANGWAGT
ncbi:MAG: stage III sporulation protein AE [Syntrophomonadaceae bacterium]|nr:stage III sporulation protein AE [Syntrophomonadaceae bacterium]